jgi:hypothetical protein
MDTASEVVKEGAGLWVYIAIINSAHGVVQKKVGPAAGVGIEQARRCTSCVHDGRPVATLDIASVVVLEEGATWLLRCMDIVREVLQEGAVATADGYIIIIIYIVSDLVQEGIVWHI